MAKKTPKPAVEEDDYVSTGYAAIRMRVYVSTIRKYFDRGILAGRKLPLGRRQISRRSLEALILRIQQGEKVDS